MNIILFFHQTLDWFSIDLFSLHSLFAPWGFSSNFPHKKKSTVKNRKFQSKWKSFKFSWDWMNEKLFSKVHDCGKAPREERGENSFNMHELMNNFFHSFVCNKTVVNSFSCYREKLCYFCQTEKFNFEFTEGLKSLSLLFVLEWFFCWAGILQVLCDEHFTFYAFTFWIRNCVYERIKVFTNIKISRGEENFISVKCKVLQFRRNKMKF